MHNLTTKQRLLKLKIAEAEEKFPKLISIVSEETGVSIHRLIDKGREDTVVDARQMFCKVAKINSKATYKIIAGYLGKRSHVTVLKGIERINGIIETDERVNRIFNRIEIRIKQS